MKANYRIKNENGTFLNAGTGENSWFTLEEAKVLVNYQYGQKVIESDGVNVLWEVL